jgi:hypothetical protein
MTDEDRIRHLVRGAFHRVGHRTPSRDLWPLLIARMDVPIQRSWSWFDVGLAAAVGTLLIVFPEWLLLLAYHL